MNRRGSKALVISIILVVVLIIIIFAYFALRHPNYDKIYRQRVLNGELVNPVSNLSIEEARIEFNESFIYYILYNIKAYNLHNAPLSSSRPKIQFHLDEDRYYAIINSGEINVSRGEISDRDIVIRTNKDEAIKMLKDKYYIQESFSSGKSGIDLVASKSTLFGKGYLNLYNELTGKSVTGNVIKIYTS